MIRKLIFAACLTVFSTTHADSTQQSDSMLNPNDLEDKQKLIAELSAAMGKEIDPNDPKSIQAAEAFLITDASKAYAFTKIHAVPLEFCPNNQALINALSNYKNSAKNIVALGEHYYINGFELKIGNKHITKTGAELTAGLNEMLDSMRKELLDSDNTDVTKKCNESSEALTFLVKMYGG